MGCTGLFDVLKNITSIKNKDDLGTEHFNPYMIIRFLSMSQAYVPSAAMMNRFWDIPKIYQEILLFHFLPKRKEFFRYIKKNSGTKDLKEQKEKIMKELKCSERKAQEIISFHSRLQEKKNGF